MEIDGKGISDHDLARIEQDDAQAFGKDAPAGLVKTRMQKARDLLEATDRQYTIVAAWTGQEVMAAR